MNPADSSVVPSFGQTVGWHIGAASQANDFWPSVLLGGGLGVAAGIVLLLLQRNRDPGNKIGKKARIFGVYAAISALSIMIVSYHVLQRADVFLVSALVSFIFTPWFDLHFSHRDDKAEGRSADYRFLTSALLILVVLFYLYPILDRLLRDADTLTLQLAGNSISVVTAGSRPISLASLNPPTKGEGERADPEAAEALTQVMEFVLPRHLANVYGHSFVQGVSLLQRMMTFSVSEEESRPGLRRILPEEAQTSSAATSPSPAMEPLESPAGRVLSNLSAFRRDQIFTAYRADALARRSNLVEFGRTEEGIREAVAAFPAARAEYPALDEGLARDVVFNAVLAAFARCILYSVTEHGVVPGPSSGVFDALLQATRLVGRKSASDEKDEATRLHDVVRLQDMLRRAMREIDATLSSSEHSFCDATLIPGTFPPPSNVSPYPTLAIVHLLAATEAYRQGRALLAAWLGGTRDDNRRVLPQAVLEWYEIRAGIDSAFILFSQEPQQSSTPDFLLFYRNLLDRFRDFIGLARDEEWPRFCAGVSGGTLRDLVGRSLAFSYATQRSSALEFAELLDLRPRALSSGPVFGPRSFALLEFGFSAPAFAAFRQEAPRCFRGVPGFEAEALEWQAAFSVSEAAMYVIDHVYLRRPVPGEVASRLLTNAVHALEPERPEGRSPDLPSAFLGRPDPWQRTRSRAETLATQVQDLSRQRR